MAEPTTTRQFLLAALVFGAIIAGAFAMISSSLPSTGSGDFTTYNNTYNKFESIRANSEGIGDNMSNARPKEGVEGIVTGLWDISFGAVQQAWTSITTMKNIITQSSGSGFSLRLPDWFTGLLIALIVTTFAFAIIASVRKWNT